MMYGFEFEPGATFRSAWQGFVYRCIGDVTYIGEYVFMKCDRYDPAADGWTGVDGRRFHMGSAERVYRCAYCGRFSADPGTPPVADDVAWAALATGHAPDCRWVRSRAHRI